MKRFLLTLCLLAIAGPLLAATDALDELNAQRARKGLRPFLRDNALTEAAARCADLRAAWRRAGHTPNDFAYVPAGARADGAGCGAGSDNVFLACLTESNYQYAGAAWARGADGKRYMHLFVSGGSGGGAVTGRSEKDAGQVGRRWHLLPRRR